jgi:hypothetical protein
MIMGAKSTLLIKISPVGLIYLYTTCYIYINLLRVSLIATFFILVVNIIKDLLLLAKSTCVNPLDIEILVINIIEDILLLIVSTCIDPLVLLF